MQALTGLAGFDWLLVLLYAFGAMLVLQSYRRDVDGTRVVGLLVVPAAAGVVLVLFLAGGFRIDTEFVIDRLGERKEAVVGLVAALVTGFVFADFLVSRLVRLVAWLLARTRFPRQPDLALAAGVALPVAALLLSFGIVEERLPSGRERSQVVPAARVVVRASHPLPGQPMDLVLQTASRAYVSFAEGWIGRLELPAGTNEPRVTRVADGLRRPRGLAIVGNELFVAELGRLPCPESSVSCKGGDVPGESVEKTERALLRESRARILALAIRPDGSLGPARPILTGLPVANSDHAVNDVEAGPDGLLYVSIGNLDRLYATQGLERDLRRPHARLLGTVSRLSPDGTRVEVVARGLRNVYGLAFGRDARLFGVDNDGPSRSGWRGEEVLRIGRGMHFGYPADGTFAPYSVRTEPPLWVLDDAVGSRGVEVVRGGEGPETLVVGGCSSVDAVALTRVPGGVSVSSRSAVTRLLVLPGCVTAVESVRGGLALTVLAFTGEPQLILVDLKDG